MARLSHKCRKISSLLVSAVLLASVLFACIGCKNSIDDNKDTKADNRQNNMFETNADTTIIVDGENNVMDSVITDDKSPEVKKEEYPLYIKKDTTIAENGYYYIVNHNLHYYDTSTKTDKVCCTESGCPHGYYMNCNAFVDDKTGALQGVDRDVFNCIGNMMFYHNEFIYMISNTTSGDMLVKCNKDYTSKEPICNLTDEENERCNIGSAGSAVIFGDYLYYLTMLGSSEELYQKLKLNRIKLEKNAVPQELGTTSFATYAMEGGAVIRISGEDVFVLVGTEDMWFINTLPKYQYRLCRYDVSENLFTEVKNISTDHAGELLLYGKIMGASFDSNVCMDSSGNAYVIGRVDSKDCIIKMSLSDIYSAQIIYTTNNVNKTISSMYYDGSALYIYEQLLDRQVGYHKIIKMNTSGKTLAEMDMEYDTKYLSWDVSDAKISDMKIELSGGDDNYIVVRTKSNGVKGLLPNDAKDTLSKNQVANGTDTYAVGLIAKKNFGASGSSITKIYAIGK